MELVSVLSELLGSQSPEEFDEKLAELIEILDRTELSASCCPVCQGVYST